MQDHASKDGEQKDEKNQAKSQQEQVEKKNWKELVAGVLVGETSGGEAHPRQGPPVCGAWHARFGAAVSVPTGGVARSASFPSSVHYRRHCAKRA